MESTLDLVDAPPPVVDGKMDVGHILWTKTRVHQRNQLASKWHPRRYSEHVEITGSDGGPIEFITKSILED